MILHFRDRLFCWVAALALGAAGSVAGWGTEPARTTLRVGVWTLWHDHELVATPLNGASTVRSCANCATERGVEATVRAEKNGLVWSMGKAAREVQELDFAGGVKLRAHGESLVLYDPVQVLSVHGTFEIVATVPVERYVEMAVAAESGVADSEESRKALAVVARSFALDRTVRHAGFDVCDSTHCQWLRWRSTPEAHVATLATAGEILWWHGQRMGALFHQNCGGQTAAAHEIWPRSTGQQGMIARADPWCQRVGSAEWSAQLSLRDLTAALATAGLAQPGWTTLRVAERTATGRVAIVEAGHTRISGEDFRMAVGRTLGWNQVRSDWFEIAPSGAGFVFHGRGSGHGVGLCQTGAAEMARVGKDYAEILAEYFPQAVVADVDTGRAWMRYKAAGFRLETTDVADQQYLPELVRALTEAESRGGLQPRASLVVRSFASTPAFRNATLTPGWVAAFTEGDSIATQPLRVLVSRHILGPTALHEFLHALVEAQTTAATPLWLREGLVEAFAGEAVGGAHPAMSCEQASAALAHAQSEKEAEAGHRAAGWYAAALLHRYGRAQVLEWLQSGPPISVVEGLR